MSFFKKIKDKFVERKKQDEIEKQLDENRIYKKEDNQKKFDVSLKKSSGGLNSLVETIVATHTKIDESLFEDLQEQLILYDVGFLASEKIVSAIKDEVKLQNITDVKLIASIIVDKLLIYYIQDTEISIDINLKDDRTNVVLVVGVNGVGKTTSIAKIAYKFKSLNKKVLLIAGDTFRAGAVEQLKKWAEELNVEIITPKKEGQDPASVIYEGLEKGYKDKYDLIICDTSGRLQNKVNLMNELNKINGVINKFDTTAPHETLLILDATTGQSGLNQAKAFKEVTNITGIVLTKMDSSSKGGIVLAIKDLFNIPVKFIGLGEKMTDLKPFDVETFVNSIAMEFVKNHE